MRVGINDIGIYLPQNVISIDEIISNRDSSIKEKLIKAKEYVKQNSIRFPNFFEDSVTMGSESIKKLLSNSNIDHKTIRYLISATETGLDFSKPTSNYILGLLNRAGIFKNNNLSSFQVQHACAGGTLGMLSILGLLNASKKEEHGIMVSSDIARYDTPSTAEITQGAGSVSLLLSNNPKLISIDIENIGYNSNDVDDFFRPLNSITAKVKGRYSLECYNNACEEAILDYCKNAGITPKECLEMTDIFIFHVPYYSMPLTSLTGIVQKYLGYDDQKTQSFLKEKGFYSSIEPVRNVGNLYTGAIFFSLACSLKERYETLGDKIVGKKILFASYGSGNVMVINRAEVMPNAIDIIKSWDFSFLNDYKNASFEDYNSWVNRNYNDFIAQKMYINNNKNNFYLKEIRDKDFYRIYDIM